MFSNPFAAYVPACFLCGDGAKAAAHDSLWSYSDSPVVGYCVVSRDALFHALFPGAQKSDPMQHFLRRNSVDEPKQAVHLFAYTVALLPSQNDAGV